LFAWKHAPSPVDWAGVIAAVCFGIALIVEVFLYQVKPERTWYEGRAAAESVKTLSWRYAVGGEPFNIGVASDAQVADLFLQQLRAVFDVVKELDLAPPNSSGEQITQGMRATRASSLQDRQGLYEKCRVEDQQDWYRDKALWNKRRANSWTIAMLLVEAG